VDILSSACSSFNGLSAVEMEGLRFLFSKTFRSMYVHVCAASTGENRKWNSLEVNLYNTFVLAIF